MLMAGAGGLPRLAFEQALESLETRLTDLESRQAPRRFRLRWREREIRGTLHRHNERESLLVLEACLGTLPYSAEGPALRRQALALLAEARTVAGWTVRMDPRSRWTIESRTRIPHPPRFDAFIAELAVLLLEFDLRLGDLVALLHPCPEQAAAPAPRTDVAA